MGIGVFVVEDDDRVRRALVAELVRAGFAVVGEHAGVGEALAALAETPRFDVALVDLRLGDGSGVDVIRRIREVRPDANIVALTVIDDAPTVLAAVRAGARGYLLKDVTGDRLATHVRDAAAGGAPMTPRIARTLLDFIATAQDRVREQLTPREREVLGLLCEGATYRDVGARLGVALATVQSHVKAIYGKLEVRSKAELTAFAFRQGLVD